MPENPLASEESFQKFVNGLCCNGCQFFVDEICTEKDHDKHDEDKSWTIQGVMNDYLQNHIESDWEFVDHINNYYVCEEFESRIPPKNWRINKSCNAYPCHENLEDCTFCYCPFYACGNLKRGKYIVNLDNNNPVWDCSKCLWIHKKSTVDKIFKEVQKLSRESTKIIRN